LALPASTVFAHGIASGDPLTDRVMIWTRVSVDGDSVPVTWTVARDPGLSDIAASGETVAEADRDHTVNIDVAGLEPGAVYHYGFSAEGEDSPVGRTWTLRTDLDRVRFATCSCAKHNAGFFNAYARIAERDDLDFLLHLGDYIYEASNIPAKGQTPGADIGRLFDPLWGVPDARRVPTRYAQYHRDPDVQALHRSLPIIATLDDHELADGAWDRGPTRTTRTSTALGGPALRRAPARWSGSPQGRRIRPTRPGSSAGSRSVTSPTCSCSTSAAGATSRPSTPR
jgi:alkaline phosphatase D